MKRSALSSLLVRVAGLFVEGARQRLVITAAHLSAPFSTLRNNFAPRSEPTKTCLLRSVSLLRFFGVPLRRSDRRRSGARVARQPNAI